MFKEDERPDSRNDVGELLTEETVGKTLYSHSAACQGRIVKLFIIKVGYTHTSYNTEDGHCGFFCTGNQGKGGRNWEAVNFELARKEALAFLQNKRVQTEQSLRITNAAIAFIEAMKPGESFKMERDDLG